ncbi:uncharacterized protein K452DRAFT_300483 [Aplosporella prunicola CBS 121167]|uniref:Uncharacterized protein n=1 Tax=Aplosporella prunicola CBS 121167 TaxID=1176127 RepID=A0A6A6B754_9PEZI|nr:uncharacterized protein K452DRAFT_300483 [Aplosporella prunicola CBS 121167]KAF2139448.1 hypothetical protein K452DRAFT_300483 [Aplosporella prunicola CBS 121167]
MPTIIHTKTNKAHARKSVGFAEGEITGISRPASIAESWALYDFEMHARNCAACRNPYEVHKTGGQLCEDGHRFAQAIARCLYMRKDGQICSTGDDWHMVRIEISPSYEEARGLLRAVERAMRHRRRFVSMDKSYPVAPRLPERPKQQHKPVQATVVHVEEVPTATTTTPRKHRAEHREMVDWPVRSLVEVSHSKTKRGSLYEADVAEQRRAYSKYHVEVREPSHRDIREHRSSGYYR